jgi:glutathione S-transferase
VSDAERDSVAEGSPYMPADPYHRAQALGWQFFEQYEIEPNLAVARFLARFDFTDAAPLDH